MALSIFKNQYKESGEIISDTKFYLITGATLFFGFFVNVIEVEFFSAYFATWHIGYFLLGYFICTITGMIINVVSKKPLLSFIGYCMVILPLGALFSVLLPYYAPTIIRSAFIVTCLIAGVVMLLAVVYPNIFNSIWKVISTCFLVTLLYQILAVNMHFGLGSVADWLVVLLFGCYVGIDISIAKTRPKTLDNAIDSACGLYLDLVNLFIKLLVLLSFVARLKK